MRLRYIYHSGFVLELDGFSVVMDFYKDTAPTHGYVRETLLKNPVDMYVLASHFHADHFSPEVLTWRKAKENITYIFSRDILKHRRAKAEDAIFLRKGEIYEDEHLRIKAFGSTDVGVSFLIEAEGKRFFHAGDLNNWHWIDGSTPQEVADAEGRYLKELEQIAKEVPSVDVAMFPVDPRLGTDFMRGAQQFIGRVKTGLFIPMHFWEEPEKVKPFVAYAESHQTRSVLLSVPGEEIELAQ